MNQKVSSIRLRLKHSASVMISKLVIDGRKSDIRPNHSAQVMRAPPQLSAPWKIRHYAVPEHLALVLEEFVVWGDSLNDLSEVLK